MPQTDIILTGNFAISSHICRKQQEERHPEPKHKFMHTPLKPRDLPLSFNLKRTRDCLWRFVEASLCHYNMYPSLGSRPSTWTLVSQIRLSISANQNVQIA